MSILFYDHLVDISSIEIHLTSLQLKPKKEKKFRQMIDDILHTGILEFILQKLDSHYHRTFLSRLEYAPYDPELLEYLKKHIDDQIEAEITKESQHIQKLILKDLKGK